MKVLKQYNNEDLKEALSGSRELIAETESLLLENINEIDDNQLAVFNRYKALPQFERDLLILVSKYPISRVASLYGVTSSYIYIKLKKIYKQLNEHTDC